MLYPRIANTSESQRQIELTALSIRVLVIILLPITVIGALLLPQMVWVLYGEEFAPLVDVIWLILPGVVCAAVSAPMVQYFIGAGYASKIWKISIIPLLLQLTLLFPMVNNYSFYGAAIVLSLSLFGLSICRLHLFKTLTQSSHASTLVPKKGDFELILNFSRQTMFNFLTSIKIR
jgi:O-antigen/teichoic acid export membrane protein